MDIFTIAAGGGLPDPAAREAIRSWDRRAIDEFAVPGLLLMENAALGCVQCILDLAERDRARWGPPFSVVAGPGNNGGDGLAIARHLTIRGYEVRVYLVQPRSRIDPASDAGANLRIAERFGVDIREVDPQRGAGETAAEACSRGVIIDAMLGTGLVRSLREPYRLWVEAINRSGRPVIAIDIPTGLDADTGEVLGTAVKAHHTLTMAAPKLGFTLGEGPNHTGTVHVIEIGLPLQLPGRPRCARARL